MKQDWHDLVSQPRYAVKEEKGVLLTMRDGVRVAVDIYRPEAEGTFPALLSLSPYGKDVQKLPVPRYGHSPQIGNGGMEAGDTEYFVSRGYVHVIADSRGTGESEGGFRWCTNAEQQDGYELVEWMGTQPWCNGNVGMLGMSYYAVIQYHIAALAPPHLKAIFPYDPLVDAYRESAYPGGILYWGFPFQWLPHVPVHTLAPVDLSPEELARRLAEAKSDGDIRCIPNIYIVLKVPEKNFRMFDAVMHPHDGPFWRERSANSKFDKIKVPIYLGTRWNSWPLHLRGAIEAYESIQNVPKKLFIEVPGFGPDASTGHDQSAGATAGRGLAEKTSFGAGAKRPWAENHDVILRWYDHWLKGIDSGIMDEPPIHIFVQGINEWRYEHEWPLARTKWTRFYLRENGSLTEIAPTSSEDPDSFTNVPALNPGQVAPALSYTTERLGTDVEVTGPMALHLQAALSREDANWFVELHDVDGEGAARLVSVGWLKASHGEVDEARSTPFRPFHPHTRSVPVEPGVVNGYAIGIIDNCNVFKAGHRIRLVIRGQDDAAPWGGFLPNSKETVHTVYHDPEHQSHLLLPIIP